jgi:hypothetical protein
MFRIVVAEGKGTYTPEELENLRVTGDIVCFHCNYEKSQRLFITCPVEKDTDKSNFNGFSPNDEVIEAYVNDLFNSKHRYGYSEIVGERTLQNCLKAAKKSKKDWITERIQHITGLAQQVCDMIRDKVDRYNVEIRVKLAKIIVRQAKQQALQDKNYPKLLRPDQQTRFIKEYIAKLFAAAELKILPKPWKGSPAYIAIARAIAPAPASAPDTVMSFPSANVPIYKKETVSSTRKKKVQQTGSTARTPLRNTTARTPLRNTTDVGEIVMSTAPRPATKSSKKPSPFVSRKRPGRGGSRKRKTYRRIRLF